MTRRRATTLVISIALAVGLACSQTSRERLERFFFEVPPEDRGSSGKAVVQGPEAGGPAGKPGETDRQEPPAEPPASRYLSTHAPYEQRLCAECHVVDSRVRVREDIAELCKMCHEDYFADNVGHGPAAAGECGTCHHPHRSEQKFLLRSPVVDICAACHARPDELSEKAHRGPSAENCTECHDPHFGESPFLKSGAKQSIATSGPAA